MENYTQQEETPVNAKKAALINAFIWTAISIIIFLITYYAVPNMFGNMAYGIVLMLISIGLAIYFTLDLRGKVGGYWSFREALSSIFIMFFVQHLLYSLFVLAFAKWIEPAYADLIREVTLNTTTELAERFAAGNQEAIDTMIAEAEKSVEEQLNPSVAHFAKTTGLYVIGYFIGALIFAAIFKRERPVFAPVSDED